MADTKQKIPNCVKVFFTKKENASDLEREKLNSFVKRELQWFGEARYWRLGAGGVYTTGTNYVISTSLPEDTKY